MASFKIAAVSTETGEEVPHGFRFATRKEAEAYAASLYGSWSKCEIRVTYSQDPINYPPPPDDDWDNDD